MNKKNISYLTQYDNYGMFDKDIIELIENNTQDINIEKFNELMEVVYNTSDMFNQILYDNLIEGKVHSNNIDMYIEIWNYLAYNEIDEAFNLLDIDYMEILNGMDYTPYDYYTLEDWADIDLKENGLQASALYWYDKLVSNCIHVFNGYANGFYIYETMHDLIIDMFSEFKDHFTSALYEL